MLYHNPVRLQQVFQPSVVQGADFPLHNRHEPSNNRILLIMKKTIVTLIVMGSVAFGASSTLSPDSNSKPADSQTYDAGSRFGNLELNSRLETGYVNGSPGLSFSGVSLDCQTVTVSGTKKIWTDDYTVSVWLANTASTEVLFGYAHSWVGGKRSNAIVWDATNKCIKMGVGVWAAATGAFTFDSGTSSSVSSSNLQNYLTDGLTNITLAVGRSGESMSADLWINGVKIQTLSYDSRVTEASAVTNPGPFATYSSYSNQGALVGSIALTDEKLTTASGVATLAGATLVPEPATATLSLMALCGLAARRRRK